MYNSIRKCFFSLLYAAGIFLLMGMLREQDVSREAAAAGAAEQTGRVDSVEDSAPVVALTFDDGPHPVYTERLLDGLAERNVKATFFLIGVNVEGHEDIVERIAAEGHLIGNHTYHHVQLTSVPDDEACREIDEANEVLSQACGEGIHYIRPPFGSWQEDLYGLVDMQVVLWTVDPLDWKVQNTDAVVKAVLDDVEDGDIILLHDVYKTSVEAAFRIIDELQARGFKFARVDELLLD